MGCLNKEKKRQYPPGNLGLRIHRHGERRESEPYLANSYSELLSTTTTTTIPDTAAVDSTGNNEQSENCWPNIIQKKKFPTKGIESVSVLSLHGRLLLKREVFFRKREKKVTSLGVQTWRQAEKN